MKLRIKKTGEIVELVGEIKRSDGKPDFTLDSYDTLSQLCEAVEDYEEPKVYWFINSCGEVLRNIDASDYIEGEDNLSHKEIGNLFETEEEAEKAVEKLKAWKRLKDKGFKFTDWNCPCRELEFIVDEDKFFKASGGVSKETRADLDLLFGGEE